MTQDKESRKKLEKLRDKYQDRAYHYYDEYQDSGKPSQLRAYERNELLADALTDALNGAQTKDRYADLKIRVMDIDTKDTDTAIREIEYLQHQICGGEL